VPGLVLAQAWPATEWTLVESQQRRARFLEVAVGRLGLGPRIVVVRERAEVAGRDPGLRARFEAVFSRSFGPPAAAAECGAAFLRPGGRLVVAEPPEADERRWPVEGLTAVGLVVESRGRASKGVGSWIVLRQVGEYPAGLPRRVGLPAKRPLF